MLLGKDGFRMLGLSGPAVGSCCYESRGHLVHLRMAALHAKTEQWRKADAKLRSAFDDGRFYWPVDGEQRRRFGRTSFRSRTARPLYAGARLGGTTFAASSRSHQRCPYPGPLATSERYGTLSPELSTGIRDTGTHHVFIRSNVPGISETTGSGYSRCEVGRCHSAVYRVRRSGGVMATRGSGYLVV